MPPIKLHPRLQMIRNGAAEVNAFRAQTSPLVVSSRSPADLTPAEAPAQDVCELVAQAAPFRRKKKKELEAQPQPDDSFVNVFVQFDFASSDEPQRLQARKKLDRCAAAASEGLPRLQHNEYVPLKQDRFAVAAVKVSDLETIADDPAVAYVYPADRLSFEAPRTEEADGRRPLKKKFRRKNEHKGGEGILIGVIDVGGFDFAHPDFRDDQGGTRFERIWDQGGRFRQPPKDFGFGSEFTKKQFDAAIENAKNGGFPAHLMERQSQLQRGSHGTHVASIAAGEYGVCPNARLAGVIIDVPTPADPDEARRETFSDSRRIIEAVDYLFRLGDELQCPVVINISLGVNGGSHDGCGPVARLLDAGTSHPGRAICVAAGNSGQDSPTGPNDIGFAMGRIHTSGIVPAQGLEIDLRWYVSGGELADFSENELELWFEPQDRVTITVESPDRSDSTTVEPQQFVKNKQFRNGTFVSVFNEIFHPSNGHSYVGVYLSPNFEVDNWQPVAEGVWKIRIRGEQIRSGAFHGWIERDDPFMIDDGSSNRVWRFPSFFAGATHVDSHSINSLACGNGVLAVANLDEASDLVSITSSQGPTRDGRLKPEICGPGTAIVAANGFADDQPRWIAKSGTSMASPYVAGVIGLMFGINPKLTAAQCQAVLRSTAQPLPGSDYSWRNDAGFGKIDANAALELASSLDERKEID